MAGQVRSSRAGKAATPFGRMGAFAAMMAMIGVLASGCASPTSEASQSMNFDSSSDKAVVILATSVDRDQVALEDPRYREPRSLLTHWQQYDPETKLLVSGRGRIKSLRSRGIMEQAADHDVTHHVLEVDPGDYALIGAVVGRTLTLFVEPEGDIRWHYEGASDRALAGIETQGPLVLGRNFVFSIQPGKVAYLGDFDFVHAGGGNHRIVDINYSHDEAATRAALGEYPGISAEMITLNLALTTKQAALQ
jgi:hypothetical protein